MDKTILLVDTDEKIRIKLARVFTEAGFGVVVAENADKAWEQLSAHSVELVICDMHLPDVGGHRFLKQVRQRYPSVIRIIMSGFGEGKDVVESLRDGSARMYVVKPWDERKLLTEVMNLVRLGDMFKSRQLLDVFNNMKELPALPETYTKICGLIEEEAGIEAIAKVVEQDQTIAVKLLQVANSVYYSMNTGSVRQAIVFMGLTNLKTIVLGLTVMKQLEGLQGGFFSKEVLWEHADRVNRITHQLFNRCLGRPMKDSEATAGLLHDIGRVLLLKDYSRSYAGVAKAAFGNRESTFRETEKSLMGISHDEVGGFLLNWWSLPQPIVEAAMFHHDPANPVIIHREVVAAVHVADYLAWKQKKAFVMPKLEDAALMLLGLESSELENWKS